jgi:muramoyltetrapeptide carboxypeptidase
MTTSGALTMRYDAAMVKPPPLRPGDIVRVVAPAGPFDPASFEAGIAVLRGRYQVRHDEGIFARYRYLAGSDSHRQAALVRALTEPETRAVFSARGGYGAMRLLPSLPLATLPPRWLVGFSDITALHAAWQRQGRVSCHGPVVTQLGRAPEEARQRLFSLLESSEPAPSLQGTPLVPGIAEGRLVGGNLSVLTRLLGTPYAPPFEGAVLLLEDVAERPYRLDRMWTHLALAGVLSQAKGIALGQLTGCDEPSGEHTALEVLGELAREAGLPCAHGFPVGHEDRNLAVPLGVRVRLDGGSGELRFLEPATSAPPVA